MFKLISALLLVTILVSAVPKPEEKKTRLHLPTEHESSHKNPLQGDKHSTQDDHEAFLGEDEAKTFNQLPPEESKRRLGLIVDRIDEDKDGFVTLAELKNWIRYSQHRYIDEDVNRLWKLYNPENNASIAWETYRHNVYGFMDEMDSDALDQDENGRTYKAMLKRDRRRWGVADQDLDDVLTREEFTAFLHPEENPTMRDIVLIETIEDMDKDKDGKISLEEYIADMFSGAEDGEEEPEWVLKEREAFHIHRDADGDGFMDKEEVRLWMVPKDFDHAESEAKHLIFEADQDNDEKLTKTEILEEYDIFVGSQATDFGEALARHDEF